MKSSLTLNKFGAFFTLAALFGVATLAYPSGATETHGSNPAPNMAADSSVTTNNGINQHLASYDTGISDDNSSAVEPASSNLGSQDDDCVTKTCNAVKRKAEQECSKEENETSKCDEIARLKWNICHEERRCDSKFKSRR